MPFVKNFNLHTFSTHFFLLLLVFLTAYLVVSMQNALNHSFQYNKHLPDAFMEDVHAKRMDSFGHLESELTTPKLIHYPENDRLTIESPQMIIYREKTPPWTINANHAETYADFKLVYLWEDVKIHEAASKDSYETTLLTHALTLYPDRRFAETDQEITMIQPGSEIKATGMQVSLPEGWVKLLSKARGFYDPAQHQKTPTP
jgi:lipopolysaccharide export system protein LptC